MPKKDKKVIRQKFKNKSIHVVETEGLKLLQTLEDSQSIVTDPSKSEAIRQSHIETIRNVREELIELEVQLKIKNRERRRQGLPPIRPIMSRRRPLTES